jgi:serine/threonine-protein kinase
MLTDCPALIDALREHRLLEPAQVEAIVADLKDPFPEPQALAAELVRRGWLTAYQAAEVLGGRADKLVLRDYVLLEKLGEGGMGQVFKARHRVMKNVQAVKLIRKEQMANPRAVERFYLEVQAVAKLQHPNIVLAHNAGREGDTHFLVMEYVAGADLGRLLLRQGPFAVAAACEYARQAALGLQHAHERGLVHRDVKPSNLLWAEEGGRIKVLDLGLARVRHGADEGGEPAALTEIGALMGTPDYIAPEQAQDSRAVDIRADVYSLGCTLYHLLTGQPPYPGGSAMDKILKHVSPAPVPDVRQLRPDVPGDLAAVVQRMTAKDRAARFQAPAEVATALEPFCRLAGDTPAPPRPVDVSPVPETTDAAPASSGQSTITPGPAPARQGERLAPTQEDRPLPTVSHPAPAELARETRQERRPARGFKAIVLGVLLLAGVGGLSGVVARMLWPHPLPTTGGPVREDQPLVKGPEQLVEMPVLIEEVTGGPAPAPVVVGEIGKDVSDEWRNALAEGKLDKTNTWMLVQPRPRGWTRVGLVNHSFECLLKTASIAPKTGRVLATSADETILILETLGELSYQELLLKELISHKRIPLRPALGAGAISADGRHALLVTAGKSDPPLAKDMPLADYNLLIDWEPDRRARSPELHYAEVTRRGVVDYYSLALSPDGATALMGGPLTQVVRVNLGAVKGAKIFQDIRHGSAPGINALTISTNGRFGLSAGRDRAVCVHDLEEGSGEPAYRLEGHEKSVTCAAISPDARYVLSGGESDNKVYVWRLGEKQKADQLDRLVLYDGKVTCLAFAPRENYFLVGYADGTVALGKVGEKKAIWTERLQWKDPKGKKEPIYAMKILALAFPPATLRTLEDAHAFFVAENLAGQLHYLLGEEGTAKPLAFDGVKEEDLGTAKPAAVASPK